MINDLPPEKPVPPPSRQIQEGTRPVREAPHPKDTVMPPKKPPHEMLRNIADRESDEPVLVPAGGEDPKATKQLDPRWMPVQVFSIEAQFEALFEDPRSTTDRRPVVAWAIFQRDDDGSKAVMEYWDLTPLVFFNNRLRPAELLDGFLSIRAL